jgi:hypothetical protein
LTKVKLKQPTELSKNIPQPDFFVVVLSMIISFKRTWVSNGTKRVPMADFQEVGQTDTCREISPNMAVSPSDKGMALTIQDGI